MCNAVVYLVVRIGKFAPRKSAHSSIPIAWEYYRNEIPNKDYVREAYVSDSNGKVLQRAL